MKFSFSWRFSGKWSGDGLKWSGNVRKWSENVREWPEHGLYIGNGPIWSGNVRKYQEMVRKCQKIIRNGQENTGNVRKYSGYGQDIVKKCQDMVRKSQEMSRNVFILSGYCLQFTKTKIEGKIHFVYVQPERWRRKGWQQKKETLNHPPHFYGSFFFLCSYLFCLFKSFHMAR